MRAFSCSLDDQIQWTTDRDAATPGDFGDSAAEQRALANQAAWVDFSHMGCIVLSGPERTSFMGGLVTNQVRHISEVRTIYAAMLTPQGRFLWDFTMLARPERLLLITEPDAVPALMQQIALYTLRAKVQAADAREILGVLGVVGPQATEVIQRLFPTLTVTEAALGATFTPDAQTTLWRDPRHPGFGWRLLLPRTQLAEMRDRLSALTPPAGFTAWHAYRVAHGLPRGGSDLIPHQTLPLEAGLFDLNGVDFAKGCYVGQETTARTHHRGTLKKRLFSITFPAGSSLPPGSEVQYAEGKEAGVVTSSAEHTGRGLALLRLSAVEAEHPLTALDIPLRAEKPAWATWN